MTKTGSPSPLGEGDRGVRSQGRTLKLTAVLEVLPGSYPSRVFRL
jgi:hypothetical protein